MTSFKLLVFCGMLVLPAHSQEQATAVRHETSFVVFPADCNANMPMLFGGKTLAEMDRCAAVTVRKTLWASPLGVRDAVTVAINGVKFHKAGEVKDLVVFEGSVKSVGEKSVTVTVVVSRETEKGREKIAEGEFVFVAFDLVTKTAVPHGLVNRSKQ